MGDAMRVVRDLGDGVEVVDAPEPPAEGALIAVQSAGICGSDFGYLAAGSRFVLGHELAGLDESGRAFAVEPSFGCGTCELCTSGHYNLCPTALGSVPGLTRDGGMADFVCVPDEKLVSLPDGLDVRDAALVEPTAVAWHGLHRGGVSAEMSVAVVGGGAIGLLAVAVAAAMGAPDVALRARYGFQREAGERLGATEPGGKYDVVVEAAGAPAAVAEAIELCAPGGTVVVLGVHAEPLTLPFLDAFVKEVKLVPAMAYCRGVHGRDVEKSALMLADRPEIVATLVTHRFGLDDAPEAFRVAGARGASGAIKVMVHP